MLDGPLDAEQEMIHVQRLGQEIVRAGLQRSDGPLDRPPGTDHEDRRRYMPGTYFLKQLQAIHPRQLKIADHQVRLKVIDDLERLLRAGLGIHNPAFGLKLRSEEHTSELQS